MEDGDNNSSSNNSEEDEDAKKLHKFFNYNSNKLMLMALNDNWLESGKSQIDFEEMDIFHYLDLLIYRKYASTTKERAKENSNDEYIDGMKL